MNEPLQNELVELCMLLILQEKPVSGLEMILELDKHMGLENVVNEHCFSDLREKGYGSLIFEKVDGERRGMYHMTQKGADRLSDVLALGESATLLCRLLSDEV